MRVFVAGTTGTLGRPVVKLLLSRGHEVTGLTRSATRARALSAAGVTAVVGDALDRVTMTALMAQTRPDQVLHLLTALPPAGPMRRRDLTATNTLRTIGTANLIEAAVAAGASRMVAESFVGVYGPVPSGRRVHEDEPLPPPARTAMAEAVDALRSLEAQLRDARAAGRLTTVALRIGFLYGSDVPATQAMARQARSGRLYAPRDFTGAGPFVHVDDAAAAVVAAMEHASPSTVYNVVDDQPMKLTAFLADLAAALGAAPPRHVPRWVVRLAAPLMAEFGSMTLMPANDRIKRELAWRPRYPTVSDGLAEVRQRLAEAA